jgi:3'-phosphoadenosine 5'-phosphosulfate sulfotransferase (PAPS reductase)/FAD synthetase
MKQVLGKKQTSRNEDFVKVWNNIEQLVSFEEAERLVASAVSDIRQKTAGKNVAYAWSGGKDSLALQVVCERAGINKCVLCTASKIEYPGFVDWCKAHAPKGLTIIDNPKLNIEWVAKHPEMLFPQQSKYAAQWFHHLQHRGQAIYFKEQHLDVIILGRRLQDGNYTGGKGQNIYTDAKGVTRLSPIAHWKHEEVLAVIHYFLHRQIPPLYGWKNGWIVGTGVWPARQWVGSAQNGWQELWDINPRMVQEAAPYIASAKEFINQLKQ